MLTISRKRNKIISAVSLRLALARPRADRPPHLLSSARPPGTSARLVCSARPPSGSSAWLVRPARPLGSWHAAPLRTFQTIKYLSLLYYSPWHLTHSLGNGSCATTFVSYLSYLSYPLPPAIHKYCLRNFTVTRKICYYTPDGGGGGGGSPSVFCGLI